MKKVLAFFKTLLITLLVMVALGATVVASYVIGILLTVSGIAALIYFIVYIIVNKKKIKKIIP